VSYPSAGALFCNWVVPVLFAWAGVGVPLGAVAPLSLPPVVSVLVPSSATVAAQKIAATLAPILYHPPRSLFEAIFGSSFNA